VAACVGATWIAGGVGGTIKLLAQSLRPGGSSSSASLLAAAAADGDVARAVCRLNLRLSPASGTSRVFGRSAATSWKWFWRTKTAGTDYEAAKWLTMRRWLEANPHDEFAKDVRAKLSSEPSATQFTRANTWLGRVRADDA